MSHFRFLEQQNLPINLQKGVAPEPLSQTFSPPAPCCAYLKYATDTVTYNTAVSFGSSVPNLCGASPGIPMS